MTDLDVTAADGRKLRILFRDKGYVQPVPIVLEYHEELGIHTHVVESCETSRRVGVPCCLHNPSNHRMKNWPMHFRYDRGIMERTCPHGVGHPDPDDAEFRKWVYNNFEAPPYDEGIHGCDLCCGNKTRQALAADKANLRKAEEIRVPSGEPDDEELIDLDEALAMLRDILNSDASGPSS